jgi:polyisoprenoid-binding protein YceI
MSGLAIMNTASTIQTLLILSTLLTTSRANAAPNVIMTALITGSLELDGDSTLHRYSAKTSDLRAVVHVDDATHTSADLESTVRAGHMTSVELVAPVKGLTSGDAALDRNMWKALKSDKFQAIRFVADWFEVRPPSAPGASMDLTMRGKLTVAGVERAIVMSVNAFRTATGIRIVGSKDILMTDYGIKPPTLMLGAIKTANLVVVKFDVELQTTAR